MKSFQLLLNHRQENELISEKAYHILKANADSLIKNRLLGFNEQAPLVEGR